MDTVPNESGLPTQVWFHESLEVKTSSRVIELSNEGLSPKEIAEELDIHKSTVSRHLKKAKKDGLIQGRDAA
jgi:DNA-binding NarL/FixJ family response regulator